MFLKKCFLVLILLVNYNLAYGQPENPDEWPIYQGSDLKIDEFRLRPHRAQLWSRSARLDTLFNNVQISYVIERGDYFGPDGKPKKGIRIRWVSNTHSFEDAAYVDASTFGIIKQTATFGGVQHEKFLHSYFGEDKVIRTILRNDSLAQSTEFELKHDCYYHLIIMPYLFTSSDLEAGSKFRLPYYSSVGNRENYISVQIVGNSPYIDHLGQEKTAWRVDTDHGYAKLEWYLDKNNPPYLLAYRWRSYSNGQLVSDNKRSITKWLVYEGDDFHQIIIEK